MKIISFLFILLLSGCMPAGYHELADIIVQERENKDISAAPNQCALFAMGLRNRLTEAGYEPEIVRVKTPGSDEYNHIMVRVNNFYIDNNSYWPYMIDGGLFGDLDYYEIEEGYYGN